MTEDQHNGSQIPSRLLILSASAADPVCAGQSHLKVLFSQHFLTRRRLEMACESENSAKMPKKTG